MTMPISDAAWWRGDPRRTPTKRFTGTRRNSYLVPMADGTRIAAHVFLPKGLDTLTLTFEGTVGWASPVDYLVVAPALA